MVIKWMKNRAWVDNWYCELFMMITIFNQLLYGTSPKSIICCVFGLLAIILSSGDSTSYFIPLMIQILTFGLICEDMGLYISIAVYMGYGIIHTCRLILHKPYKEISDISNINTKTLKPWQLMLGVLLIAGISFAIGVLGDSILNSTLPYLDALVVVLVTTVQILMVLGYKYQLIIWIMIHILRIIMFILLDEHSLVILYAVSLINIVYGWCKQNKSTPITE